MNKFANLKDYLITSGKNEITLTFDEMEAIIGFPLPESAKKHRAYFANTTNHSISKAWMEAGYFATDLDIYEQKIIFRQKDLKKEKILSTDTFISFLNNGNIQNENFAITCFSLFEILSVRNQFADKVFKFIDDNKIKIVDLNYNIITFDDFNKNYKNVEIVLRNIYNSIIKYSLFCCLVNSFHENNNNINKIYDFFEKDSETNLLIDFPIIIDEQISLFHFNRLLNKIGKLINNSIDANCLIQMFSKLTFSDIPLVVISGLNNLKINYCNYMLKKFISLCKVGKPYIPFKLVVEMLNVDIMTLKKESFYYTMSDENYNALYGSTINRVIRVDDKMID